MKLVAFAALACTIAVAPAQAALIGDFQLNGSLANGVATGLTLTNNGGVLGSQGISFGFNQGPTVSGITSPDAYSVVIGFRIDQTDGWRKLIDFSSLALDAGLYNYYNALQFYPVTSTTPQIFDGVDYILTYTRTADDIVVSYIDGNAGLTFVDSSGLGKNTGSLGFFVDDFATLQLEAATGFVDFIRIYDTALPGGVTAVPEPASWAMMIAGFGLVGAAMRRRATANA